MRARHSRPIAVEPREAAPERLGRVRPGAAGSVNSVMQTSATAWILPASVPPRDSGPRRPERGAAVDGRDALLDAGEPPHRRLADPGVGHAPRLRGRHALRGRGRRAGRRSAERGGLAAGRRCRQRRRAPARATPGCAAARSASSRRSPRRRARSPPSSRSPRARKYRPPRSPALAVVVVGVVLSARERDVGGTGPAGDNRVAVLCAIGAAVSFGASLYSTGA